jgi:hypothetical protein
VLIALSRRRAPSSCVLDLNVTWRAEVVYLGGLHLRDDVDKICAVTQVAAGQLGKAKHSARSC